MRIKFPEQYKNYFCVAKGIIACDYVMHRECPRSCSFAKRYHPVERGKTLGFQTQKEFDETFLREDGR